jgi:hypothetical protein
MLLGEQRLGAEEQSGEYLVLVGAAEGGKGLSKQVRVAVSTGVVWRSGGALGLLGLYLLAGLRVGARRACWCCVGAASLELAYKPLLQRA